MKIIQAILLICLFAGVSHCGADERDEAAIQAAIQESYEAKVALYIKGRKERCLEEIYEEANLIVDSILLQDARRKRDTLGKPQRPVKPIKPEIKTVIDSLPIAPLLPDSIE